MHRSSRESSNIFSLEAFARCLALVLLSVFSFAAGRTQAQVQNGEAQAQNQNAQSARQALPNANNLEDVNEYLNLTDMQRAQIRAIRQQNQVVIKDLQRQQNQAERALNEAIYSGTASEAEIENRVRAVAAAHEAIVRRRALAEAQVVRVLTPEQLAKFLDLRRKVMLENQRQRQAQRQQQRVEQPKKALSENRTSAPAAKSPNNNPSNSPRNNQPKSPRANHLR